jgi:hypothetical protein
VESHVTTTQAITVPFVELAAWPGPPGKHRLELTAPPPNWKVSVTTRARTCLIVTTLGHLVPRLSGIPFAGSGRENRVGGIP